MAELQRFLSSAAFELPAEALALDRPQKYLLENHRHPVEAIEPTISLDRVDRAIAEAVSEHPAGSTQLDSALAVTLHEALGLSRRVASDRRVWAWLGTMQYADYVAHRWKAGGSGLRPLERFTGNRVRQTFARLWWAAELTWSPERGYALTEELLALSGFQDLYEAVAGRAFSSYPPAVRAFIARVGSEPERVIRETAKELSYVLTTMVLEAMTEDEIVNLLDEVISGVKGSG